MSDRLTLLAIGLSEANAFVEQHHRHHKPVVGHKFSIGASVGPNIVGVVVVGRPVARMRDDGLTLEVTRLCTDGHRNACSFLYGAAARAAFALGYKRIGTYILASEPGTSLTAANWRLLGEAGGGSWGRSGRPRVDTHPTERKLRREDLRHQVRTKPCEACSGLCQPQLRPTDQGEGRQHEGIGMSDEPVGDAEFDALRVVWAEMAPLSFGARNRMLTYLTERTQAEERERDKAQAAAEAELRRTRTRTVKS